MERLGFILGAKLSVQAPAWSPGLGARMERTRRPDSRVFGDCNQRGGRDGPGLADELGLLLVLHFVATLSFFIS